MFDTVLVANRGEVARRVIRACHELGIEAAAVYSDADQEAPFVHEADQAHRIGPASPSASYLDQAAILDAAEVAGADAVHPGYGFLSENPAFAENVQSAGFTWIGPEPEAMATLGDKVQARQLAIQEDVPVAQGSDGALDDADEARRIAEEVGYPVMLKAAAGGGGMGMRVVESPDQVDAAFKEASQQAESAFGDGSMFLEKYLDAPRHIEVQIIGDADGDVVHLFERECSIQRRHQKLVEEAPSPALTGKEREAVGAMATRLAEAGAYTNAGTLEFLYQDGTFHFNEMNTRLQVEHPVTELVTGLDLVHAQLRVAAGDPLSFTQDEVTLDGHAIELRINAEDPYDGFLPRFGTIRRYERPEGDGLRIEDGIREGWTVPADYDSLLAKLIAWAPNRSTAIERLQNAVRTYRIGAVTNLPLHRRILQDTAFQQGQLSTNYLTDRNLLAELETEGEQRETESRERAARIAAALALAPRGGLGLLHHRHTRPSRIDQNAEEV